MRTYVLGARLPRKRGHRNGLDRSLPNWRVRHRSIPAASFPCQVKPYEINLTGIQCYWEMRLSYSYVTLFSLFASHTYKHITHTVNTHFVRIYSVHSPLNSVRATQFI